MAFTFLLLILCFAFLWIVARWADPLSLTARMLGLFFAAFALAPLAFAPDFSRVDMATLMFAGGVSFTYLFSGERERIRSLRGEATESVDPELSTRLYRAFLFVAAAHAGFGFYTQFSVILVGEATLWVYLLATLHFLIATLCLSAQRAYRGAFTAR